MKSIAFFLLFALLISLSTIGIADGGIPKTPEKYLNGPTVIRGGVRTTLTFENSPTAGTPTRLYVTLQDQASGLPLTPTSSFVHGLYTTPSTTPGVSNEVTIPHYANPQLQLDMHESIMHVLIVRDDLTQFYHVHPGQFESINPEEAALGIYSIPLTFPEDGSYWMWVQFTPTELGSEVTAPFQFQVKNGTGSISNHLLQPDFSRTKNVDGYTVSLKAPEHIKSNLTFAKFLGIQQDTTTELTFYIQNPDGSPQNNLWNVLGVKTHSSAFSSDGTVFSHEHAEFDSVGPYVSVRQTFPKPGIYLITAQFRPNNLQDITSTFLVKVEDDNYASLVLGFLFWTAFWIAFVWFVHVKTFKLSTHHTWLMMYVLLWAFSLLIHTGLWTAGIV